MAGDWIKMREALHEDPAVLSMANGLCTRPEHVVGYCHRFWSWVSRNCHDGTVTGVTLEALESVLNMPGFCSMLCKVKWLEYDNSGETPIITIPNFDRHLSQGAKSRALNAERQRDVRNGHVTKMSRSNRDKTTTREEKRREEPPPPTPASLPASEDASSEWEAVVVELHGAGMARTQSAIRAARDAMCTPGDVRGVLAHFNARAHSWTPGALHDRILELRPGQDPESLWPPPSTAAKAAENGEHRTAVAAKAAREREAGEQRTLEAEEEQRKLERDHGPTVNELNADDMRIILGKLFPRGWGKAFGRIPDRGIDTEGRLRDALLSYFDSPIAASPTPGRDAQ